MASRPKPHLTPDEYLALERAAPAKSEYLRGEVYAMARASEAHNLISFNLQGQLYLQLRGRPCKSYARDMRVHIPDTTLYTYLDITVVCGEARFDDDQRDTLLNPTLLIEILSPSTEAYDRGEKFAHYRRLPSLQEYLLVAQDKARVEQYIRQADGSWRYASFEGLDASLTLPSIGVTLLLADIYERLELAPDGHDAPPAP